MLFGLPTLIEFDTLEECADLCRELKLDFIELSMSLPQYTLGVIDRSAMNKVADEYGIFYTIHLDENVNFCDFNTYMADATKRYIADALVLAKQLKAPVVNMHFHRGEHFTLPNKKVDLFAIYRERYIESVLSFRDMCENVIGDSSVKICIENCNGYPDFQKEALDILLESDVFGLTFDIGHNHSCGNIDEPYITENKHKLYHMHMHDAWGKKNHLALGTGGLDINKYLSLAKECNCRVVLETKTVEGLKQSVDWIRLKGVL